MFDACSGKMAIAPLCRPFVGPTQRWTFYWATKSLTSYGERVGEFLVLGPARGQRVASVPDVVVIVQEVVEADAHRQLSRSSSPDDVFPGARTIHNARDGSATVRLPDRIFVGRHL